VRRLKETRAWILAASYTAVLTAVSLVPSGSSAGPLEGWDTRLNPDLQNVLHVPAFGLMVFLLARAMDRGRLWQLGLAAVACVAFGALLEWGQAVVPGRFGSLGDVLLNAVGVVLGTAIRLAQGTEARAATAMHLHDRTEPS